MPDQDQSGPDERLYVATGEAGDGELAQDDGSLNGKFLRLTAEQYRGDGEVRPEIYSKGHRNPQGFNWQDGDWENEAETSFARYVTNTCP